MSKRRIARRQIAAAHLRGTARSNRLLAAAGGDEEHAARIEGVLEDLAAHSCRSTDVDESAGLAPAPVISLPLRPYDRELDVAELELPGVLPSVAAWLVAIGVALAAWAALAAVAFALYSLAGAL